MRKEKIKPALLIVDMQNRWVNPNKGLFPSADKVVSNINQLREAFRSNDLPIFHIILEHNKDGSTWERGCKVPWNLEGSWEAEIIPALTPQAGETILVKTRYSAFFKTDLVARLNKLEVDQIVITGYQMRACVLATSLDAYQNDFKTFIISDASLETDKTYREMFLRIFEDAGVLISTKDWKLHYHHPTKCR